jgi:hypothetical protein
MTKRMTNFNRLAEALLAAVFGGKQWATHQIAYQDALKTGGGLGTAPYDGEKLHFDNGSYMTYPEGIKNGTWIPKWELHDHLGAVLKSGIDVSVPVGRLY